MEDPHAITRASLRAIDAARDGAVMDINAGTIKYGYIGYLLLPVFLRATQWYINGYTVWLRFPPRVSPRNGCDSPQGTKGEFSVDS